MYVIELVGLKDCNKVSSIINVGRSIGAFIGPLFANLISSKVEKNVIFFYAGFLFTFAALISIIIGVHNIYSKKILKINQEEMLELKK